MTQQNSSPLFKIPTIMPKPKRHVSRLSIRQLNAPIPTRRSVRLSIQTTLKDENANNVNSPVQNNPHRRSIRLMAKTVPPTPAPRTIVRPTR